MAPPSMQMAELEAWKEQLTAISARRDEITTNLAQIYADLFKMTVVF
jgi:hypothetical protein